MDAKESIMALAQSEKLKTGIIWLSQLLQVHEGLGDAEARGAEKLITALSGMVMNEVRLADRVAGRGPWREIEGILEQGMVMIRSGVPAEALFHLTQALSHVTNTADRAMKDLAEGGLL
ncbi:MAG: hypothetical protein JRF59_15835 [Deltaproteobacteria bacterium]|nr:hypothetical protein [Deltaproteobacteria bacterium]MBW1922278.1 hypothetical protein [Deltaproteobacteria bacterium]MBW1951195.1 hypothetical protein [Deltaproteobacteria bacterium]MBW2009524.1 hypothetical protein [Deltaproteobacteria bacterium]MBW2349283.1 hypothetical protein [Deltaproteobacteria bacterium]